LSVVPVELFIVSVMDVRSDVRAEVCVCDVHFSRYYRTLEKQCQIDELEQENLLRDRERFLLCAVDNFIKCLRHHDKYDLRVFRLVSLWFDNASLDKVSRYMKVCTAYCCRVFNIVVVVVVVDLL